MISLLDESFTSLNDYIFDLKPGKILILVDENTHHYCLPTLLGNMETDVPFEIIEIEAGEELKNIEYAFCVVSISFLKLFWYLFYQSPLKIGSLLIWS